MFIAITNGWQEIRTLDTGLMEDELGCTYTSHFAGAAGEVVYEQDSCGQHWWPANELPRSLWANSEDVRVSEATYRTTLQQIGSAFEGAPYAASTYTTAMRIVLAVNGLEA